MCMQRLIGSVCVFVDTGNTNCACRVHEMFRKSDTVDSLSLGKHIESFIAQHNTAAKTNSGAT